MQIMAPNSQSALGFPLFDKVSKVSANNSFYSGANKKKNIVTSPLSGL